MRATYEDLLRTARRMAVNAHRGRYVDEAGLMADWDAVVAATVSHLRWLRSRLRSVGRTTRLAGRRCGTSLGRLAVAIGAAGDLLATQDPATVGALDRPDDLAAARAELGAIVLIGARAVLRNIRTRTPGYEHLLTVMAELESLARSDVRRVGLGALGGVTAGGPSAPVDDLSLLSRYAARWERAHQSMPPRTMLTRDLRSTTAQLRTVCGHVWHLADQTLAAPSADLVADIPLKPI